MVAGTKRSTSETSIRTKLLALLFGCVVALSLLEVGLRVKVLFSSTGWDPLALSRTATSKPVPYPGHCDEGVRQSYLGDIVQASDTPGVIFELKPGTDSCYYGARIQTNRDGQRALHPYARPKPERTYRVLLLGDSVTFGQAVEYEETFGQLIERALEERHPDLAIEVINTGVDGYNTYQQGAFLTETGMAYEPDVVMILWVGNDLDLPFFLYSPDDPLATDRLYVGELIRKVIGASRPGDTRPPIPVGAHIPAQYAHMAGIPGYETGLKMIADAAVARGIPVLDFVAEPVANVIWGSEEARAKSHALAVSLGIIEVPFDWPHGHEVSEENMHPNPEGHQLIANQMLAALDANGIAPVPKGSRVRVGKAATAPE